jgi:hypothetical protein
MQDIFLCVLTRTAGRISNVERDYPVSGSFTRAFPLSLIEVCLYLAIDVFDFIGG